jgi:predicted dehydrogenase
MSERPVRVGVIGVGSMGSNHVRVYQELPGARLCGVADADPGRAAEVAREYDTVAMARDDLLDAVDAVSVAVPTPFHYEVARDAIDHGVHLLVEKPFVQHPSDGRELIAAAEAVDVTLQVGHIERFNPAVEVLTKVVSGLDVIAIQARRLGPPVGRNVGDGVVLDLMIHDIDVLLSLVDAKMSHVDAAGTRNNQYVSANVCFENGVIGGLEASRLTQERIRKLSVTTTECQINLDYLDQSVLIHRQSTPAYVESEESLRYRNESVTERPLVETGQPLRRELEAFLRAVRSGDPPVVTGEDGLRVLELASKIDEQATANGPVRVPSVEVR